MTELFFDESFRTFFVGATGATFSSSLSSDCEVDDDDDDDGTAALTGGGGVAFAFFFVLLLLFFFLLVDVVSVGCCFLTLVSLGFLSLLETCFEEEFDFDFVDDEKKRRHATV